jgi:hypothetical protein
VVSGAGDGSTVGVGSTVGAGGGVASDGGVGATTSGVAVGAGLSDTAGVEGEVVVALDWVVASGTGAGAIGVFGAGACDAPSGQLPFSFFHSPFSTHVQ